VDYFNNTLQPGETFPASFGQNATVLAKTNSEIVGLWMIVSSDHAMNGTYVANPDGQIMSFTLLDSSPTSSPQIQAFSYCFTREVGNPSITSPGGVIYTQGTTGHSISWTITDAYNGSTSYQVLKNGSQAASTSWTPGTPVIINVDGLKVGVYNYTIIANDGIGGTVSNTAWVVVVSASTISSYPLGILAVFGAIGFAAVAIVARQTIRKSRQQ
jgi:hypothetical protein